MLAPESVTQMQRERTDRARAGLANGEFKFSQSDNGWLIENRDGKQYSVTLSACTCQDFTQRGQSLGFTCKHIEAARILFSQCPGGQMDSNTQVTGWTKLFHPAGAQVSLPLPLEPLSAEQARAMFNSVGTLIDAGFMVSMPGLEEGELAEEVSAVSLRNAKDNTPIIDFYSANTKLLKKFMHLYLNNEQDVADFEAATGLHLAGLTVYDGSLAIARDDNKAGKYIAPLPRPVKLVWKLSPKWEEWKVSGGEGQEPHKRLLVRYEAKAAPVGAATSKPPTGTLVRRYLDGSTVNGDVNEQAAFDAYCKHNGSQAAQSKEIMRAWVKANPGLVTFTAK
ncbi:MAG: hypothetical protein WCK35_27840 [Chloroflexota bacterium]